jgi:HTH-type transcriptional regulator/antitoxin HigA
MKKEFIITSKRQYHETMAMIYRLMNKGEDNLAKPEIIKLRLMTKAAEKYEDEKHLI